MISTQDVPPTKHPREAPDRLTRDSLDTDSSVWTKSGFFPSYKIRRTCDNREIKTTVEKDSRALAILLAMDSPVIPSELCELIDQYAQLVILHDTRDTRDIPDESKRTETLIKIGYDGLITYTERDVCHAHCYSVRSTTFLDNGSILKIERDYHEAFSAFQWNLADSTEKVREIYEFRSEVIDSEKGGSCIRCYSQVPQGEYYIGEIDKYAVVSETKIYHAVCVAIPLSSENLIKCIKNENGKFYCSLRKNYLWGRRFSF